MGNLSYTGGSNIIIRDFNTKEVLIEIEGAEYSIQFSNNSKISSSGIRNLAAFEEYSPNSIILNGKILNESISKLLYKESKNFEQEKLFPNFEFYSSDKNGVIMLNNIPDSKDIQIRESNGLYAAANNVDFETGIISNLKPNSNYNVIYYSLVKSISKYEFSKKRNEYVSIEIVNDGNRNNLGSKMYMKIEKASLNLRDSFDFSRLTIAKSNLEFTIIDNKIDVFYY